MTIEDIALELHLDWHALKELDKQYMRAQPAKAGTPGPKAICIDEIPIRNGHTRQSSRGSRHNCAV